MELTLAQRAALTALVACCEADGTATPRTVALALWPNSAAWTKRSRRHDGVPGGYGATMPMKAATMLWKLHARGLAALTGDTTWTATAAGHHENNR